jgi:hypothetical protein
VLVIVYAFTKGRFSGRVQMDFCCIAHINVSGYQPTDMTGYMVKVGTALGGISSFLCRDTRMFPPSI